MLAWYFPNRYVDWSQSGFGIPDSKSKLFLGNQYANFWGSIVEVLEYTRDNLPRLVQETRDFRDAMFNSSLPWQLVDSAAGRIVPIRSPSCMWLGDGTLYCFEGCSSSSGCCPLNCTHVLDYAMALSRVWPDLEQTMRTNDLDVQISPNGAIPSRSTVPTTLRRQWSLWPDYTEHNPDQSICADGEICTVLKCYREVLMGATQDWFNDKWHQVKKIMERWMTVYDSNGDGVVTGAQPSTYDCPIFGANTFMGTLYLAALRASEEMALLQNDQDLANTYHARFLLSSAGYDKRCFTTKPWYTQEILPTTPQENLITDGTFVDSLLGQWWAYILNLGPLLSEANIVSNLTNIFQTNHVDSFDPARQSPRKFCDNV